MDSTPNQPNLPNDYGLLHRQIEMGLYDGLIVTINGVTGFVSAREVQSVFTPRGEFHIYGEFGAIGECQIQLIARNTKEGSIELLLDNGSVAALQPIHLDRNSVLLL